MFDLVLFRRPVNLSALSAIDLSRLVRTISPMADATSKSVEAIDLRAELDAMVNAAVAKALTPQEN